MYVVSATFGCRSECKFLCHCKSVVWYQLSFYLFMMTGHQTIFCCRGKGRVEVWYFMWSLWYPYDHPSCHILQHKEKGSAVLDQILDSSSGSVNVILPNFDNIMKKAFKCQSIFRFIVYQVIFLAVWLYASAIVNMNTGEVK